MAQQLKNYDIANLEAIGTGETPVIRPANSTTISIFDQS